jgi:hypothetical protein
MPSENPVALAAGLQNVASLAAPTVAPVPVMSTGIITQAGTFPRTAQSVPVILPAGTPVNGQVQPTEAQITVPGDRFYVLACSSPVAITPFRAGNAGTQNTFGIGQGREVGSAFEILTVRNYTTNPIVALIWVGFDDFINNQLIIATNAYSSIAYPTYPVANVATTVLIPDISGKPFVDINGKKWGAISRQAILIFNLSAGTYLLQALSASTGTGPAIAVIPPAPLPLQLQFSGDCAINVGGASVNMVVSEIYYAIPLK